MTASKERLLGKIAALRAKASTPGEKEAAEAAFARIVEKYGLEWVDLESSDSEKPELREYPYSSKRDKLLLLHIAEAVLGGKAPFWRVRGSRKLGFETTVAQDVELRYMHDYYRRLYEKEEEALYVAFVVKHSLFDSDAHHPARDERGDERDELAEKALSMMDVLSYSELHKALPGEED